MNLNTVNAHERAGKRFSEGICGLDDAILPRLEKGFAPHSQLKDGQRPILPPISFLLPSLPEPRNSYRETMVYPPPIRVKKPKLDYYRSPSNHNSLHFEKPNDGLHNEASFDQLERLEEPERNGLTNLADLTVELANRIEIEELQTVDALDTFMEQKIKGGWSTEEDLALTKTVRAVGARDWSRIASFIPGRTNKQCRDRWLNHLSPAISKAGWSSEEDRILMDAQARFGNVWARISKLLPGRPYTAVKNRWYGSLKGLLAKQGGPGRGRPPAEPRMPTGMMLPPGSVERDSSPVRELKAKSAADDGCTPLKK